MSDKLNIGILTEYQYFSEHDDWQKHLMKRIIKEDFVENLKLINVSDLLNKQNKETKTLAKHILGMQYRIEKKINPIKIPYIESDETKIDTINILFENESLRSKVKDDDELHNSNFDIIINISPMQEISNWARYAKYGVWELQYLGHNINNKEIGIIELLYNKPNIQISIINHLPNNTKNTYTINYNIHFSIYRNSIYSLFGIVSPLLKHLKNHENNHIEECKKLSDNSSEIGKNEVFQYLFNFYKKIFSRLMWSIFNKIFGIFPEKWGLSIGAGSILQNDLSALTKLNIPASEFWADPFLFKHSNNLFLFFERFSYSTLKGCISYCKLSGDFSSPLVAKDILNLDYHLSYPYIFKEGDEVFLIPESSERKRLEIYRSIEFPDKWELYSSAFDGVSMADTVYYKDKDGQRWIFTNLSHPIIHDHCSELYIYKIDSLKFNEIEPHKQNPVIIDSSVARNGGGIFTKDNKLYRASQINSHGKYGEGINISEIKRLSLDEYKEKIVKRVSYAELKDAVGTHHLHQLDNIFILDVCYKKL